MEEIILEETEFGPKIELKSNGCFLIKGQSMMENAEAFYQDIHDWINRNGEDLDTIEINIDLSYFNSSSAKQLLKFLMAIDELEKNSVVNWFFPEENDILKDRGYEFEIMLDIPFNFKSNKA